MRWRVESGSLVMGRHVSTTGRACKVRLSLFERQFVASTVIAQRLLSHGRDVPSKHMLLINARTFIVRDNWLMPRHTTSFGKAGQGQMVTSGWMHGYVHMYWAKKILEWSRAADESCDGCVRLNDRDEIDGHDPNGYAGIAWAVGGKHDRAWGPERPVYDRIRCISLASTSRKFNRRAYIEKWNG
jgi:hypothetical protein